MIGKTRESYQEQLYGAIADGRFPKWTVQVQIMPELDAEKTPYNPFDLTKVWPHADYPPIDIGVMELNRNAANYFAEIEYAAFSPSNVVPGIAVRPTRCCRRGSSPTPTPTATGSAPTTRRCRSTRPRWRSTTTTRTATMRFFRNDTGNPDAYYEPNSFDGPVEDKAVQEPPLRISGDADRYDHRVGNDDFSQPRALFNLFDDGQKARLFANYAAAMGGRAGGDHRAAVPAARPGASRLRRRRARRRWRRRRRDPANALSVTDDTPQHAAE